MGIVLFQGLHNPSVADLCAMLKFDTDAKQNPARKSAPH